MRLSDLTKNQMTEWRKKRLEVGQERYGNKHLNRYGLVDVMEELLDAKNELELMRRRVRNQSNVFSNNRAIEVIEAKYLTICVVIDSAIELIQNLDKILPPEVCTDEEGGERIWIESVLKNE